MGKTYENNITYIDGMPYAVCLPHGGKQKGFMAFMEQSFSGFENSFLRGTVENLIDFALKEKNHSLDQMCYFLSDILPEVEFEEVIMFMDDRQLTRYAQDLNREALSELSEEGRGCLADLVGAAEKERGGMSRDLARALDRDDESR